MSIKISAFILIILTLITITGLRLFSQDKKYSFVGSQACAKCHGTDAIGNQYNIWKGSPHSKAFATLRTSDAKKIAAKAGIESPETNYECLKCHNTGAGKFKEAYSEGVGCEACHGPASAYIDYENHVSLTDRKSGYKKAMSNGMYPILGIEGIKFRERLCLHCHNEKRACYPESIEDRKKQKIGLEAISEFIYKHPVRK